ncbi:MAG: gamma-glutamylcyclotransferase family protein [Polyangiales bacterium]
MAKRAAASKAILLFSYGSNNPTQLAERLGHEVEVGPAILDGYKRVFRGFSRRWGGGVAHVVKRAGSAVYGLVAIVSERDLEVLDRHEGVPTVYKRNVVTVLAPDPVRAVVYVRADGAPFHAPSRAYLDACAKTVNACWRGTMGSRVIAADFDIE